MTDVHSASPALPALDRADAQLARTALEVLAENDLGHATRPGPLYPHQWSWDAACIAMGLAVWDQDRAEQELRSLFAGQWDDGLLPHIVFTGSDQYFPGPEVWQTERSPLSPRGVKTSGIVQPPIHATAAWRVYRRAADRDRADAFLHELAPKLVAWHDYLYRDRVRGRDGLAEVWHPWESGMDNSPAWDGPLERIALEPQQVPVYTRVDNRLGDPAERPSDFAYDRYTHLVELFRDLSYDSAQIRDRSPFVVQPVLFNALLVQSNRDLARIARAVGEDPRLHEDRASMTADGLEKLWAPAEGAYYDYDVRAGVRAATWTAAAFTPLYARAVSNQRAEDLIARLIDCKAPLPEMLAIPSVSGADPAYAPRLYWRGPVWPLVQWVTAQGVASYGRADLADQLRQTTIELARAGGFWEHYNPETAAGQGDPRFSWTAGIVLDLLAGEPSPGHGEDDG